MSESHTGVPLQFIIDRNSQHTEMMLNYFAKLSLDQMKHITIDDNVQIFADRDTLVATKSNKPEPKYFEDVYSHLAYLQQAFIGQPLLCFYHAVLVVLLRRSFEPDTTFQAFENLWQHEFDFLTQQLSLRWLASASDTFVDFSPNPTRQAIMMNVVSLVNTLKVYETKLDLVGNPQVILPQKLEAHRQQHLPLYDGLHYFRLGSDDTLHNMKARYQKFAQMDKFATDFLLAVFDRLQTDKTAFGTMRQFHQFDWC